MAEYFNGHKLISKHDVISDPNSRLKPSVCCEEVLKGKVTALFFSAKWCPPCQEFLPKLKNFYSELKEVDSEIEIIFVSIDHTKDDMEEYYLKQHGDWLALPFDDSWKESMLNKYRITCIPKLVVIRENGDIIFITLKGRKDIQDKGVVCFRNWLNNFPPKDKPGDINKLSDSVGEVNNSAAEPGFTAILEEPDLFEPTVSDLEREGTLVSESADDQNNNLSGSLNLPENIPVGGIQEAPTSLEPDNMLNYDMSLLPEVLEKKLSALIPEIKVMEPAVDEII